MPLLAIPLGLLIGLILPPSSAAKTYSSSSLCRSPAIRSRVARPPTPRPGRQAVRWHTSETGPLHAVAELAAWICGTPMAAVSLVEDHRQFFAGAVGLPVRETSRDDSFCAVAMQTPGQPMLVPDALSDPRFATNGLVTGDPHVRSYAGVPLVAPEGVPLGAVCALGATPMHLTDGQVSALGVLAAVTVELLEARRTATQLAVAAEEARAARSQEVLSREQFRAVFEHAPLGMTLVDLDGTYLQVNEAFSAMLGTSVHELVGAGSWTVSAPEDAAEDAAAARRLIAAGRGVSMREKHYLRADGTRVPAVVTTSLVQPRAGERPVLLNQVEPIEQRRAAEARMLEVQSAYDGIISIDDRGAVTAWNLGAQRLFGYSAATMLGQQLERVIPSDLRGPHRDGVECVTAGGAPRLLDGTTQVPAVHADGRIVQVELALSGWAQDDRVGYTAVLRDVTDRLRTEVLAGLVRHAASTANRARTFTDGAAEVLEEVCQKLGWLAGHGWAAGDARAVWTVADHPHSDVSVCWLGELAAQGDAPTTEQMPLDGQTRLATGAELVGSQLDGALTGCQVGSALAVPILNGGHGVGMLAFYLPVGAQAPQPELVTTLEQVGALLGQVVERERSAALLQHQADHDLLTDLANRRLLLQQVSAAQVACADGSADGTAALVLLDLDRFGRVNTALGYTAGDLVLQEAADRLRRAARSSDVVARLGADEFVVLARGLAPTHGRDRHATVAEEGRRLLESLTGPVQIAGQVLTMTASVGVCLIGPEHAAVAHYPAAVLRDADAALRYAKRRGKAIVEVFDAALRGDEAQRLTDETDLAAAISAGALSVHYQPVVDLTTGLPHGAEALVRWPRPGHGLVPPDLFIPLAETSGLIIELGRWVLNRACADAALWAEQIPTLSGGTVAVNVSARQLAHPRFINDVDQALAASGLPADRLVLEITESSLIEDRDGVLGVLASLRDRKVQLALDDFGTGYSSLGYIQALPVDIVKIDKSFVDLITGPGTGTALSEVVLKLAEATGLRVVAEGVETPGQAEALRRLGCHYGQGYTWARPLPTDQLRTLLRTPLAATSS